MMMYSCFSLNTGVANDDLLFIFTDKAVLKLDYCLNGEMQIISLDNKVFHVKKDNTVYFEGSANVDSIIPYKTPYRGLSLMCYWEDLEKGLNSILNIKRERIKGFVKQIRSESRPVVVSTNVEIKAIVSDIVKSVLSAEYDIVKLRVLELLIKEIDNFSEVCTRKTLCFSKATVEKVNNIEDFIQQNYDLKLSLSMLCKEFNVSESTLKDVLSRSIQKVSIHILKISGWKRQKI